MAFSVFQGKDSLNCIDSDYNNCAAVNRLVVALKYYGRMNVKNDENDCEIFRSFVNEIYKQMVDDNNHFITCHGDQLKEICDLVNGVNAKCNMQKCKFTQRHFDGNVKNELLKDAHMNFYINLMDSLHFVICHCYDCGLRVTPNENKNEANESGDDNATLFDVEFARINTIIRKSDFETEPFERISPQNNAKFILSKAHKGDTTFFDELYKHLISESLHIEKLKTFIDEQLYDTESMKMDVAGYGNIENNAKDKTCIQSILQFIKEIKVQSNTFSVGIRFYYWQHYETLNTLPANEQMICGYDNKHDHGGYKISELCVNAKFSSFKKEITNYSNFSVAQYEEAMIKTNKFMKSDKIKQMSAKYTLVYNKRMYLHYGIEYGKPVSFYHILSLTLYTDFSKLSAAFSATFRKIHNFETLKSIKKRNAVYFWMSKYLRELVELFGQCSFGDTFEYNNPLDALYGPFYCGMNIKLNIGSFAMRLNSPSSTSRQIPVAIKFSGPKGVVFTFDNPRKMQYKYLRAFDCSYISRFKEEDEFLFFGGFYRIKIVNLRPIETKQNMRQFVAAIFDFDKALTGNVAEETKHGFLIIDKLINCSLQKQTNSKIPPFMMECFHSFCVNKQQIIFDMYLLYDDGDERINNLLLHSLDKRMNKKEIKRSDDDLSNIVRSELFALFPNVRTLIIQSTDIWHSFSFSLMALLNVINGTNLNEIIIKSKEYFGHCWIKNVWNSDQEILKTQYAAKGYQIAGEIVQKDHEYDEYNLKIISFN